MVDGAPRPEPSVDVDRDVDSPDALMALLAEVEEQVPVDRWTVGSLRVWPLVRIRLAHRVARLIDGRPARPTVGAWGDLARRGAAAVRGSASRGQSTPRHNGRPVRPLVVVCGDGVSFLDTSAGPIDRHADPFRKALAALDVDTALLEPGHHVPSGLDGIVVRAQPALDRRLVRAYLRPRSAPDLPGYEDAQAALTDHGLGDALPAPAAIALTASVVEAMAGAFEVQLERLGATTGAVVEFYALQGAAFVLACRRQGVPVIDIQHGLQGPSHYAYASWHRAPSGGYELLPDRFWVWGDDEVRTIAEWAPEGEARCLAGGNLELRSWMDGSAPGAAAALQDVRRLVPEGAPFVLVALSDEESDAEIEALLDTIAEAPTSWRWGLRCHPTDPAVPRWERAVRARGLIDVEVRRSTELPLFALLRRADVLLTRHSSVVLDAAGAGVPAVVTGPIGAALFQAQIEAGQAVLASEGDVVAAISDALHHAVPAAAIADPAPALRGVAELAGCAA